MADIAQSPPSTAAGVTVPENANSPSVVKIDLVAAIRARIEELAEQATLATENAKIRRQFADLFPDDIPSVHRLPTDVYHRFWLKDPNMVIARRQYTCPKKYHEAWKMLLQQHLDASHLRPSSSPYASPAFLIPKKNHDAPPHWVNDYRQLNANTVSDAHVMPNVKDILGDIGKGQFWAKIDMTNAFFQTCVHLDDIELTAVNTPMGDV